jgi:ribosomal protein S18 acetylase RimI-like enzyme
MADSEYKYEIIDNEDDARDCAQLIAEEFSAYNPITVFDHITPTCFFEETSWPLMKDMLHEHLSFLARHRPTNEIIAAVIAGDLYLQHKNKHLCDTSNLLLTIPVGDLLDEMDNLFISRDFGQELKPNMILHITVCAVRSQHAGKGVAKEIVQNICDYAREKQGFQYILVQVTNQATRHIFVNKMGGTEVTVIDPTTWIWKKKGDELSCPYKDYKGGSIPNILVKL